jgi:CheY-like chemotaxis protein
MPCVQYSTGETPKGGYLALNRTLSGLPADAGDRRATAAFVKDLRRALRHLYDPVSLRHSPLLGYLGVEQADDPLAALRGLLLEAIQAFRPGSDAPSQSNAWRVYQILFERYAEQFSQEEVAIHLALGTRQLRRQESHALRLLADYLWARHCLSRRAESSSRGADQASQTRLGLSPVTPSRDQELEWLSSYPCEPASAAEVVEPVLKTIAPLSATLGVQVHVALPPSRVRAAVQLTSLRQALSNVITAAIRSVPGGQVDIVAASQAETMAITIRAGTGCAGEPLLPGAQGKALLSADDLDNLDIAGRMVSFSKGALEFDGAPEPGLAFGARLILPALVEVSVLVVDDNADTLQLLRRYLEGTRYRFTGTDDPAQVLTLAQETEPRIILLDVMLPGIDGWELLGRLRAHPAMREVPIIVCTILAQEQMALALGAAGFLRKPVSREALLAALDRLASE